MAKEIKCFHYGLYGKCHLVMWFTDVGQEYMLYKFWIKTKKRFEYKIMTKFMFDYLAIMHESPLNNIKYTKKV